MNSKSRIKRIILTFFGTVLAYFFSTKEFAQSVSFFYGPGDREPPPPKTTLRDLDWWLELPLKYIIPGAIAVIAIIVGFVLVIKKRRKKNAKTGPPKAMDDPQRKDKKGP